MSGRDLAVAADGISVAFDPRRPDLLALDGVSLSVCRGEVFGIVGESGSGKTTLGRVLLGLVRRTAGSLSILGAEVPIDPRRYPKSLRAQVQPVFQDPGGALDPMRTVAEALDEPLVLRTSLSPRQRAARIGELLDRVGLREAHASRYPHELSGGQKQRVSIARALAANPAMLVLDEPLSALDVSTQAQVLRLLAGIREASAITCLLITHDLEVLRSFATRALVLERGRAVETGAVADVLERPRHEYTRRLVASILSLDPRAARARLEEADDRIHGAGRVTRVSGQDRAAATAQAPGDG